MEYPSGTDHQDASYSPSSVNEVNPSNRDHGPESSDSGLKHNPGISTTMNEQPAILEAHLQDASYSSSSFNEVNPSNGDHGPESLDRVLKHDDPGIFTEWTLEELESLLQDSSHAPSSVNEVNSSNRHHGQDASYPPSFDNEVNPSKRDHSLQSLDLVLKYNPGIKTHWTKDEQEILENALKCYPQTLPSIMRYARIAKCLQNKTIRDVALRLKWMERKEYSKTRNDLERKRQYIQERAMETPTPMFPMDHRGVINYHAMGGVTGELLKQNAQALNQISANLSNLQIQDNPRLLIQTHDNLRKIMNEMNHDMPEIMKRMPPIPVRLNEIPANTIPVPPNSPNPRQ